MTPDEIRSRLKDVITDTIKGEDTLNALHSVLQAKMQARIAPESTDEDDDIDDNDDDDTTTTIED